jgi:hypothetical protein
VEDFSCHVEQLGQQTEFYVWTFAKQLTFSVDYNEAFYEEETIMQLIGKTNMVLLKELQLAD